MRIIGVLFAVVLAVVGAAAAWSQAEQVRQLFLPDAICAIALLRLTRPKKPVQ